MISGAMGRVTSPMPSLITSFSGWALKDANTPDYVTLKTTGVATGSYTVVLKASTTWKDYYYTVKVNVQ